MNSNNKSSGGRQASKGNTPQRKNSFRKDFKKPLSTPKKVDIGGIRLNKFISNSGICSRREADTYIEHGSVTVNGNLVTEMGYKVQPNDDVRFDGTSISPEKKKYVLLNKPKNYITTMDDDRGRKTVMELVSNAANERIYPVGRLDRMTTGLLLFTNDGELAKKLTHPKHDVKKLYQFFDKEGVYLNVEMYNPHQWVCSISLHNGIVFGPSQSSKTTRNEIEIDGFLECFKVLDKKIIDV